MALSRAVCRPTFATWTRRRPRGGVSRRRLATGRLGGEPDPRRGGDPSGRPWGDEVGAALADFPAAVVTDVGSVKAKPLAQLRGRRRRPGARYVGGHPMAGSERSGPMAAAADLFDGRTWAVVDRARLRPGRGRRGRAAGRRVRRGRGAHDDRGPRRGRRPGLPPAACGGGADRGPPAEAPGGHLALSGQGLRDVTRVAAGDPRLWRQIVTANADAVERAAARAASRDRHADRRRWRPATRRRSSGSCGPGCRGVSAIPGKHGGPSLALATVTVAIPDEPGALARLFADAGGRGRQHRGPAHRPRPGAGVRAGGDRRRAGPRRVADIAASSAAVDGAPVASHGEHRAGRPRDRHRRHGGLRQVLGQPRRRPRARPALSRHRSHVPGDDLADAPRRRRRQRRRGGRAARRLRSDRVGDRPELATISLDGRDVARRDPVRRGHGGGQPGERRAACPRAAAWRSSARSSAAAESSWRGATSVPSWLRTRGSRCTSARTRPRGRLVARASWRAGRPRDVGDRRGGAAPARRVRLEPCDGAAGCGCRRGRDRLRRT